MPIIARENTPLLPFVYTPEGETVTFKLRGLSQAEVGDVQAYAILNTETKTFGWPTASIRAGIKAGLINWEGVCKSDGTPVPYKKNQTDPIETLGLMVCIDIFGKIMGATGLNEDEAKN